MPHAIVQLEQRLEQLVEWFKRLTTPAIDRSAAATLVELPPLQAPAVRLIPRLHRLVAGLGLGAAFVLGTQEAAASALSLRGPFDALRQVIAVVAAVGRDIFGGLGKLVDFDF